MTDYVHSDRILCLAIINVTKEVLKVIMHVMYLIRSHIMVYRLLNALKTDHIFQWF